MIPSSSGAKFWYSHLCILCEWGKKGRHYVGGTTGSLRSRKREKDIKLPATTLSLSEAQLHTIIVSLPQTGNPWNHVDVMTQAYMIAQQITFVSKTTTSSQHVVSMRLVSIDEHKQRVTRWQLLPLTKVPNPELTRVDLVEMILIESGRPRAANCYEV